MDLWDVVKVVWRRRLIAIPLLLITIGVAGAIPYVVRPDYQTVGHVTLLPPSTSRPEQPSTKPSIVSPWNVYSLADAVVIYANRADVRERFQSEGFSAEWTASIGGTQLPVIELEVIASSADMSRQTLLRLIDVLKAQLASLQAPYGAVGSESITGQVLDSGQNVEVITSAVNRTIIVVVAIGFIVTVSLCLWVDALFRRRSRTASGQTGVDLYHGPVPGGLGGAPIVMPQRSTPPPSPSTSMVPSAPSFIPSPTGQVPAHAAAVHVPDIKVITIDYRPTAMDSPSSTTSSDEDNTHPLTVVRDRPDGTLPVPSDATIVLPLTARRWTDVDAGGGPNGSGANGR